MIDESRIVGELKKQHTNLLDFIDKLELSHEVKMELFEGLQSELNKRSLKEAYEYGVKIGSEKKEIATPEATPGTPSFSEAEESVIKKYVDYFKQNGLEASIPSVSELSPRDKELIEEASRRVNEEYADTFAQYVSPAIDSKDSAGDRGEDTSTVEEATTKTPSFSESEEAVISRYVDYFKQNGLEASIPSVSELSPRDKELIEEASRRVNEEYADTFAQYVSPGTDDVGEVDSSILSDATSSEDKPSFTDEEEDYISVYTNYFRENGLDAPIHSVTKLSERTKELINEAMNRVAKENEGPHK